MADDDFGARLTLVLKALTLSNGRVAAALAVDKSLVGRWTAGSVHPSAHSLSRLTTYLATLLPGLTLLDWDLPVAEFRRAVEARIGRVSPPSGLPAAFAAWMADTGMGDAAATPGGRALTGFWRTTRPCPELPGRFLHDAIRIMAVGDGALGAEVVAHGAHMKGWTISVEKQMFLCVSHIGSGFTFLLIANHLGLDRIEVMDGIVTGTLRGGGGSPTATPIIMERVGDTTGDAPADEARFAAFCVDVGLAPEGTVPDWISRHLASALAPDGIPLIAMPSITSLTRRVPSATPIHGLRVVASMD